MLIVAALGTGGIIRDVLCMGAQPVALVDSLYFGDPDNRKGQLTERFIHLFPLSYIPV